MRIENMKISDIKPNQENPRTISSEMYEKLKKSLQDFPEMLETRPLVIDENNVVLGGNMRLKVLQDLGYEDVPVKQVTDWTEEQKKEFIVKDNVGYGEWDWDILANEWDVEQLEDWGLEEVGFDINADEFSEDFSLPDGDKPPFQQMTFTLADEQAEFIKTKLADMKKSEEFKYVETFGNENSNGNALYFALINE